MTRRTSCPATTGHLRPLVKPVATSHNGGIYDDLWGEVAPGGVDRGDEIVLPGALEMFELLLAGDCLLNIGKGLEIDKFGAIVFVGERGARAFGVLVDAALETVGNADIEDAVCDVGHKVDVSFVLHHRLGFLLFDTFLIRFE